jgi:hypothetical protein
MTKTQKEYSKFVALDTFINDNWSKMSQEDYIWCLNILRVIVKRIIEE